MSIDYEVEYDNRARVPEHPSIAQRWAEDSLRYRNAGHATLDIPYGAGERQKFDLFIAAGAGEPVVVYIHGGYWQRGDRRDYSCIAQGLNARGVTVAVPSYTLCPAETVSGIVAEMRECLRVVWQKTGRRPVVVGHSAGGHLAAAMLATNWSTVQGVPADLVKAAYSISGVFDLPPLIGTTLNTALRLDANTARAASPMFWHPPTRECRFVAAVGGLESSEFLRQSLDVDPRPQRQAIKSHL